MGFPGVIEEFAGFFRRIFSWHQFRRFKQCLSGLITGRKATVRSIAARLVEPADQSSLNSFLILYGWDDERVNRRRVELLQSTRETRWSARYHGKRRMSINEFREAMPREAFREVKVQGKSHWVYTRVLDVNKLGRVRVVIFYDNRDLKGEPIYLATNRLYWEERRVIQCYGLRFRIDTFYKDAKQNLSLGGFQLRSLKGTRRHWLLGILAYSLLKRRICRSRLYRRLQSDQTIGAECRQAFKDLLQNLIQWIYNMANRVPVDKILDLILR